MAVRDYLAQNGISDPVVLFTTFAGEPAPTLIGKRGDRVSLVTDDPGPWHKLALENPDYANLEVLPLD